MFTVRKEYAFEAAHFLPEHEGKCHRLHGHSYRVAVAFGSRSLQSQGPSTGMVIDFDQIDQVVKPLIEKLDHYALNDVMPEIYPPTAENIAHWFADKIRYTPEPAIGYMLREVTVWETAKCSATWTRDDA